MMSVDKKIVAAVLVRFKNIITSTAIKITLLIALVMSIIISFYPYFQSNLINDSLTIKTNLPNIINAEHNTSIKIINNNTADIFINEYNNKYELEVKTQNGYNNISNVIEIIKKMNVEELIEKDTFSDQEVSLLVGGNINIKIDDSIAKNDELSTTLFMSLAILFFFIMTLLVSRIGTQVAFEKGNKTTEIILTSITKKQLYLSQVIAGALTTIISFVVVSIPIVIAYNISDPTIATNYALFTESSIVALTFHFIIVGISLVILSIGICSTVKQAEDSNSVSALILIPTFISYTYYILTLDMYNGVFSFLNYIPIFSIYPIFGNILADTISNYMIIIYCIIDVIFLIICFFTMRNIFCKKISIQ